MLGISEGPFLDANGQKVLDNGFYRIWEFSEGLAVAMEKRGSKWGYIDHSGSFVIPPQFPEYREGLVGSFQEGLAAVETRGKLGYIDHSGKYAIEPRFVAGTSFEDGIARVVVEGPCAYFDLDHFDPCMRMSSITAPQTGVASYLKPTNSCKWTFIDRSGREIIGQQFEEASAFHEGLAVVKVGKLYGYIDKGGKFAIPPSFDEADWFSSGLALASRGAESGFINKKGSFVIRMDQRRAERFSEGLAAVGDPRDGYIYIDTAGKQAIPERFALASRFFHGLAHVKVGEGRADYKGTFAYIDRTGKRVYTYRR